MAYQLYAMIKLLLAVRIYMTNKGVHCLVLLCVVHVYMDIFSLGKELPHRSVTHILCYICIYTLPCSEYSFMKHTLKHSSMYMYIYIQ